MLSSEAKYGFTRTLQLGCFLKLLPYKWDSNRLQFSPPSSLHLKVFNFHKNLMYSYTVFMILRLIQASRHSDHFPLQQKVLSASWTNAFVITSVGFFQLQLRRVSIMHFANRILETMTTENPKPDFPRMERVERHTRSVLSWHVYMAIILLYTNPGVHSLIQYESPCAPNYVSSTVFPCRSIDENIYSFAEKSPFVVLEFYAISMFLYICCFHWSLILMGLTQVNNELRKMECVTVEILCRFGRWHSINHRFRQLELMVTNINDTFHYYLMVFPSVLLSIVAFLLFGSIRLWHISPQSNLMFPLCGARCGFEAVTPLAMAGNVNQSSDRVLTKWKEMTVHILRRQNGMGKKFIRRMQGACRRLNCSAGSLYTFEKSIVLCSITNCFQLTLNLLVTFGKVA